MPTCGSKCIWRIPYPSSPSRNNILPSSSASVTLSSSSSPNPLWCGLKKKPRGIHGPRLRLRRLLLQLLSLPLRGLHKDDDDDDVSYVTEQEEEEEEEDDNDLQVLKMLSGGGNTNTNTGNTPIVSACITGLITGITVVFFNIAVHGIRDFCWDGIAYRGASWLREEPVEAIWARVILVPVSGGLLVSILSLVQSSRLLQRLLPLTSTTTAAAAAAAAVLQPIFRTIAACVTLGTGNSLGPEGPSVEIGASVSKAVAFFFDKPSQFNLSLRAAGSAAGISSGFNAAVAGCFFAVESVLWPSPPDSSLSLTNTTSMVILSSVIASVVSEIGLGSEPAFSIPQYDFRSPTELPLYLLLGILCGLVSLSLSRCTSFMQKSVANAQKTLGLQKETFPVVGGLAVGLLALLYPEILYWGFENVDILLESRPFVKGLSVELLIQLVGIKILATSLCRASGLVGGYYAPSLFIGAATGMAYGKVVGYFLISQSQNPIFHLSIMEEVASPQAYGLVGMAATLAGVCEVPLTAVLLLFELTQDYRIVLPLLGAVGTSSWITSRGKQLQLIKQEDEDDDEDALLKISFNNDASLTNFIIANKEILVSQAMRTKYVTVMMNTLLKEAVSLMLLEKQSCAVIVDDHNLLIGVLTLDHIQLFTTSSIMDKTTTPLEDIMVSQVFGFGRGTRFEILPWSVTPNTSLYSAQILMDRQGVNEVAVILENSGHPVGILDRECIRLASTLLLLTITNSPINKI